MKLAWFGVEEWLNPMGLSRPYQSGQQLRQRPSYGRAV